MTTRADDIIDRRRLRRKLTFWRVAALLVLVGAIGLAFARFGGSVAGAAADHIARIRIEGTITENEELLARLKRATESERVKGVILTIDSPGGTTAGGEAIFEAVRKLAEAKPVAAQVGTLAASAGYMIATATDHIVARQSSIVGSIGVLFQYPDVTGLMDKIGIKLEGVKSSPLKAEPSPFSPTTEEERAMIRSLVMDSYDWFVTLVDDRRPTMSREEVLAVADGSIFTGRQALARKLVDEIGDQETAKAWLVGKGLSADLEIVEWKPRPSRTEWLLGGAGEALAAWLGLPAGAGNVLREVGADRIFLDGLVSVWQPDMGRYPAK